MKCNSFYSIVKAVFYPKEAGGVGVAGRARESPYPMISVEEAQKIVLDKCRSLTSKVGG